MPCGRCANFVCMRIHLMPDDKFIDTFIENSELISNAGENLYLINGKPPFKYVHHQLARPMPEQDNEICDLVDTLTEKDNLYLHSLPFKIVSWLANRKKEVKAEVAWIFWGAEFFQFLEEQTYAPITKSYYDAVNAKNRDKIYNDTYSRFPILNGWRRYKFIKKAKQNEKDYKATYQAALGKVNTLMHYNPLDMDLIRSVFDFPARFQYYYYPPAFSYEETERFVLQNTPQLPINSSVLNIWVANSATPTSNHLDALQAIQESTLSNIQLWLPTNYGDNEYLAYLKTEAEKLLPGKVYFITEYMSFGMFCACIAAMDVSLLWHKRSQAFGNVQMLLFLGKKVFMHPESTLYRMLVDDGYRIWSVADIDATMLSTPLSAEDAIHNREKVIKEFSKSGSREALRDSYAKH